MRPGDQNVRSKLNLKLGDRIMNVIFSMEPLLVVSDRNIISTDLGKKRHVLERY